MFLTGLDRLLRDADVPFTTQGGWQTRTAHDGGLTEVCAVMWHTTETGDKTFRASSSDAPTLAYVTRGAGYPLYNILIGRDGTAHLVAAGTAGHAGRGSGFGMPRDDANRHAVGVSFDANGAGHPVTDAQLETGARIGAAFNEEWRGEIRHVMHGEWAPDRRTDPTGVDWEKLRAAIDRGHWATDAAAGAPEPDSEPEPEPEPESDSEAGERTPVAPDQGRWPEAYLTVVDEHNEWTDRAWRDLMDRIGLDGDELTASIQTWLRGLGYDAGPSDGWFGERTTRALQECLRERGHYGGLIDGDRGPMTITAEVEYLNRQAEIILNR
ncbi:peptidoglycan recognition protein family protein [Nesterenkonia sp. PF2B19]|uniref:peptidoglycan recognition protein family protein n=1 Tax=Nesterenkonia sp. PF2B19 TaxID=1881858 RepID=UPI0008726DA1|nr:N-acetylmuramoyl-L-alanine amidase [Nesterenkonia sp. PF2B19]